MGALDGVVTVNVALSTPAIPAAGFGTPLIVSQSPTIGGASCVPVSSARPWPTRTRTYTQLSDVLADFPATTPEYCCCAVMFAQSPTLGQIKIGQAITNRSTQTWLVIVANAVAAAATYKMAVVDATGNPGAKPLATMVYPSAVQAFTAGVTYGFCQLVTSSSYLYLAIASTTGYMAGSTQTPHAGTATPGATTWDGSGGNTGVEWLCIGAVATTNIANDAVIAGLKYQILGDGGTNAALTTALTPSYNGTIGSGTIGLILTGASATTTPVAWAAPEIYDPTLLAQMETTAAPSSSGLVTDLTALASIDPGWYGLITLFNSGAYALIAEGWAQLNAKLYGVTSTDSCDAEIGTNGAYLASVTALLQVGVGGALRNAGGSTNRFYTYAVFHQRACEFLAAAEMARFFPIDPGGDNWRLKPLAGVTPGWGNGQQFSSTELNNLQGSPNITSPTYGLSMGFFYILAGANILGGWGQVSGGNQYIDVVRFLDWWVNQVQTNGANLLIAAEKIPFTDVGIAQIEQCVMAANAAGVAAGGINPGNPPGIPAPIVTVPKAGSQSSAQRATRNLPNVNTTWVLAGAINSLKVNANVSP